MRLVIGQELEILDDRDHSYVPNYCALCWTLLMVDAPYLDGGTLVTFAQAPKESSLQRMYIENFSLFLTSIRVFL